ncbi:MAG: M28 family peptidase [Thermoplasmatales archaeon]|nr:M28 family peptidase [Thermoplasmatales archaeon]
MAYGGKDLTKRLFVLSVFILLVGISIIPSINGNVSENGVYDKGNQAIGSLEGDNGLDLQFIYNLTENLSNIIFTEYNESAGEIAKGRAFGTKGEHKAAQMLFENFSDLGLYTYYEKLENTKEKPYLATNTDINERGLTVIDKNSQSITNVSDYYISPRVNLTYFKLFLDEFKGQNPIIGTILEKIITSFILRNNGSFDRRFNLYDFDRLTHNFSYKGLKVLPKPTYYSLTKDIIRYFDNDEPFVYIDRDYEFTNWPPAEQTVFDGILYDKIISKLLDAFGGPTEYFIWTLFHPNCKGIIKFDSNNDAHNTGPSTSFIPVIRVNKTVGEKIYDDPENYTIDFYLNQSWNESVESYNVIGQLNGTNEDETIIVCSLYDSWWCQGTGDAAIGMSMVVAIAKYFKENNIVPRCNVKFIGFCGEEYGLKGAFHYENTHKEENISYIIDLNQIGFTPVGPEEPYLKFQMWTNNEGLISTLDKFPIESNYTNRTGIEYQSVFESESGPSNVHPFCHNITKGRRKCDTILVVKTGVKVDGPNWLGHHKDGINHTHGDSIDIFNWTDTEVTGELALNLTIYFTVEKEDDPPDNKFKNLALIARD